MAATVQVSGTARDTLQNEIAECIEEGRQFAVIFRDGEWHLSYVDPELDP